MEFMFTNQTQTNIGQVINALKAAIERPDLISAECIDGEENLDLAQR